MVPSTIALVQKAYLSVDLNYSASFPTFALGGKNCWSNSKTRTVHSFILSIMLFNPFWWCKKAYKVFWRNGFVSTTGKICSCTPCTSSLASPTKVWTLRESFVKTSENPSFSEQKCHFRKYFTLLWIIAWLERAYFYDQNLFLQRIKVGGFHNLK